MTPLIYASAPLDPLKSGFDPDGAEQLKGKLVGYNKWIGTAGKMGYNLFINSLTSVLQELYVAFTYRGIP